MSGRWTCRDPRIKDMTGKQFDQLTVLCLDPNYEHGHGAMWKCRCSCGNEVTMNGRHLRDTRSHKACRTCAIRRLTAHCRTHGKTGTPENIAWQAMRQRCNDPNSSCAHNYSERGITIDPRWDEFEVFLADVGLKPSPRHSLERVENNGNYEPSNVIWALPKVQARNTRANRLLTLHGETKSMAEWAEQLGISYTVIRSRLNRLHWTDQEALTIPIGSSGFRKNSRKLL